MTTRLRSRAQAFSLGLAMLCAPLTLPVFVCCASAKPTAPSAVYPDAQGLAQRLESLERSHRAIVRRHRLVDTSAGHGLWLLELGKGNDDERRTRPALLVVAGIEGDDPFGTSVTLTWAEQLAARYDTEETIRALLDDVTVYVVPRVNLDAAESMFEAPQLARPTNLRPADDDHDGLLDEDPPDDLDKDGRILWMRVEDPEGTHILDPLEPRLLVEAKATDGEPGRWRYLIEGIDNDGDERWNEDPVGGVNFNRNFPHDYQWFAAEAGTHQVSEPESRALADFVVAHPNIAVAFTFGRRENLASACPGGGPGGPGGGKQAEAKSERPRARGGSRGGGRGGFRWRPGPVEPVTTIDTADAGYLIGLADRYREELGLAWGLADHEPHGTFGDWMYFHRGRLSLSTAAWSPSLQRAIDKVGKPERPGCGGKKHNGPDDPAAPSKTDAHEPDAPPEASAAPGTTKPADTSSTPGKGRGKQADEERNREQRAFLEFVDKHAPDLFVAWKPIEHPDFPGQRVEVGGFVPYAEQLPPPERVESLAQSHAAFLTNLAGSLPRVAVRKIETKHLGDGVYDVKIQVENRGYLPTSTAQGETTSEVHPTRVVLDLDAKHILAGRKVTTIPTLAGSGGMHELHYTLYLGNKRRVDVEVISMIAGTAQAVIDTKGTR